MSNYFRITAYHPAKNICAIFDSNGRFEKLWQFSAYFVQKGFKIVEVGSDDKFLDGNIPKASVETLLILRACAKGQPLINGDTVEVNGKNYKPGTFTVQNNDCGKHVCTTKSAAGSGTVPANPLGIGFRFSPPRARFSLYVCVIFGSFV